MIFQGGGSLQGGMIFILPPTYSVTPDTTSVNEGNSVVFTINTERVNDDTELYWTIQPISGEIDETDFTALSLSGSFFINNNTGLVTIGIREDFVTEGTESFALQIRTGSTSGTVVATSVTVSINDTSSSGLYAFTTATFTPGTASGSTGPSLTQARAGLSGPEVNDWRDNTEFFNTNNGIQLWTVPKDGNYRIEAWGAEGGDGEGGAAGRGARMRGDFSLIQGEILRIVVGQRGIGRRDASTNNMGGGGGGTYIVKSPYNSNQSILLAVGGGGGSSSDRPGVDATITTFGSFDENSGPATDNGNGGISFSGNSGGGGGGFFTNGQRGVNAQDEGKSFLNGSRGCYSTVDGTPTGTSGVVGDGGFGGGGGMYWASGSICGAGGGGYSGGNGGNRDGNRSSGGGGGSFNSGTNQDNSAGVRTGHGQVTITLL
jgi:hypothetical protein